jgi:hypothetical protein
MYVHLRKCIAEMTNISDNICSENQNTRLLFDDINLKMCVLYEIMWINMVEPEGPLMTIWRNAHCMLHTLRRETPTHNSYWFSTATVVT